MAFGLFGILLSSVGIISKLISSIPIFIEINSTLSSGLILLGAVSFMIGLFAHVVFKRQAFSEKDLLERIRRLEKFKE
jgi:ABC-type transport system involved in multi-copper enzyme maturation permease subunit